MIKNFKNFLSESYTRTYLGGTKKEQDYSFNILYDNLHKIVKITKDKKGVITIEKDNKKYIIDSNNKDVKYALLTVYEDNKELYSKEIDTIGDVIELIK